MKNTIYLNMIFNTGIKFGFSEFVFLFVCLLCSLIYFILICCASQVHYNNMTYSFYVWIIVYCYCISYINVQMTCCSIVSVQLKKQKLLLQIIPSSAFCFVWGPDKCFKCCKNKTQLFKNYYIEKVKFC